MLHFFGSDSGFLCMPYGRVRAALSTCTDGDCQLHQSARLLIERAGIVASLSKVVKCFPNLWIGRSDLLRNH